MPAIEPPVLAVRVVFCSALLVFAQHGHGAAASPAKTLTEAIPATRTAFSVVAGGFAGAGAGVLEDAIEAARYVLIGEAHFTREVPAFTAAVCDRMAPGLAAIAVEAGPSAVEAVDRSLQGPTGMADLRTLLGTYPDSIAFLNGREEHALLAHCAGAVAPRHLALWGLDQEFLGAAARLFDLMLATDPGPRAAAALKRLIAAERVAEQKASASGDPSPLWLMSASQADVDALRSVIEKEGDARAQAMMTELASSRLIYRMNATSGAGSNRARSLLMKRHLAADLARAALRPAQKVLFKFGGNHAFKGYGPLGLLDLGNQVTERADAEGTASLHILVLAAAGTTGAYGGHGRPLRAEAVDPSGDSDLAWSLPFIEARLAAEWTLYDLRLLRRLPLPGTSPGVRRLIEGYDLMVVVPNASAAELISP